MGVPTLKAWRREPLPGDENLRTKGAAPGWAAWNGKSAEVEFCDFGAALCRLVRPQLVIETGVGQGYMTRRLAAALPEGSTLVGFESDPEWREALRSVPFWKGPHVLADEATPDADLMRDCGLAVLDSTTGLRIAEIDLWLDVAPMGSFLLVHDVSPAHPEGTVHRRLAEHLSTFNGMLLPNPRGGFLARKG